MTFRLFECEQCGYQCRAIGGVNKDQRQEAVTCVCDNKKLLIEVTTKIHKKNCSKGVLEIIKKELNSCPYCHDNKYHIWPDNHPCPKCESKMTNEAFDQLKVIRENNRGLFVVIVFNDEDDVDWKVYLVNDSDNHYKSINLLIGGYTSQDDEPPIQMGTDTTSLGEQLPHSYLQIDSGDFDELDYHLWTNLVFTTDTGKKYKKWFEIGGSGFFSSYDRKAEMVSILGLRGVVVEMSDGN